MREAIHPQWRFRAGATLAALLRAVALPIGVQIIGGYLDDRTTMALAGLIEREFGGFTAPPGLTKLAIDGDGLEPAVLPIG